MRHAGRGDRWNMPQTGKSSNVLEHALARADSTVTEVTVVPP